MKKIKKKSLRKKQNFKSVTTLIRELEKTIIWQKKGIGHINKIKGNVLKIKEDSMQLSAYKIFNEIEKGENVIQEMIEWRQQNNDLQKDEKLNKIYNIVDAFLTILNEKFNIDPICEVGKVIETPLASPRTYSFQNKINPSMKKSIVLKPGLKIGNKTIFPALLEQIE